MKFKNQNIVDVTDGVICHGVNCQGVMGSGVAKAIRDKWPRVFSTYVKNGKGKQLLGTTHIVCVQYEPELYIANCYTQDNYGRKPPYATLEAIEESLRPVFAWADTLELTIHSPKIGCGLGGLSWDKVSKIYEDLMNEFSFTDVVIYDWKP